VIDLVTETLANEIRLWEALQSTTKHNVAAFEAVTWQTTVQEEVSNSFIKKSLKEITPEISIRSYYSKTLSRKSNRKCSSPQF
jgi:hypothetical protein